MIITAAGLSSRHPDKLFYRIRGETALCQTVSIFLKFKMEVLVVTGHERERTDSELKALANDKLKLLHNPNYAAGLSSSLVAAVQSLPDCYDYYGFCNGDKPFIELKTVRNLIDHLTDNRPLILAPTFGGIPGHPVFFHHSLRKSLLALQGDTGGQQIIRRYQKKNRFLPVADEGVVLDMDRDLDEKRELQPAHVKKQVKP